MDVHTNSVYGLPIIRKADAHAAFKEFINTIVTKFKVEQIFRVHSDRDPCLTSGLMKEFFDELKIQYRTTTGPESSYSNGRCERSIRTLTETIVTLTAKKDYKALNSRIML